MKKLNWHTANTTELESVYDTLNYKERLDAFVKFISNQRLVDKFGVGYFIGMIDHHNTKHIFVEQYKREVVVAQLVELVTESEKNLYRCIQSEWTRGQIALAYLNSKK